MNVPSARASRASVARQYRSASFAVIFDPACAAALFIAVFILHSSKLTHPKRKSYPLTRTKVISSDCCPLDLISIVLYYAKYFLLHYHRF
jgi:hypothetical protein